MARQRVAPNASAAGRVLRDRLRQRQRVRICTVRRVRRLRRRRWRRRRSRRHRVYFGGTRRCVRHSLAIVGTQSTPYKREGIRKKCEFVRGAIQLNY